MPRTTSSRTTGKPRAEINYGALEDQDHHESQPVECRPAFRISNWMREWKAFHYVVLAIIGISLVLALFFLGVAVAVMVRAVATDNTGYEPDHPDFALYKNNRFKECYNLAPDAQNCTNILSGLSKHSDRLPEGFGYVDNIQGWKHVDSAGVVEREHVYDWCQVVSCFNGFKIIPSTARPSATILSNIVCWWTIMMTSASALWHTGSALMATFRRDSKPCRRRKDLSWIDYVFFAYDICGPILWWWVSFIQFAVSPAMSTTIAVTSWVTTWKLAALIRVHPYSCALPNSRRIKRILPWVLNTMAVLQWIAGVYVMTVYLGNFSGRGSTLQSYECLASQIPDAPGSTTCSAGELCSKDVLFRGSEFTYDDPMEFRGEGRFVLLVCFWLWTLMALLPFVFLFFAWCHSSMKTLSDDAKYAWRVFNPGPNVYLAFSSFICLAMSAPYAVHVVEIWDSPRDHEGPFIYHTACNALHVPLSPWRDYLDTSAYARAFRIAKMVFNA